MLTRLELVPEDEWEPAGHSADGWAHKKPALATCSLGVESLRQLPIPSRAPPATSRLRPVR